MGSSRAEERRPSRLDQLRAGLSIAAALGAVAAKAAGKAGLVTVGAVFLFQSLNLKLWRRDSATLEAGGQRFVPREGRPGFTRAAPIFVLEELAWLGIALWQVVLGCWALGVPVHPLMYAVMLLLVGVVLLQQLYPQLRGFRGAAPKRPVARPPGLH